MSTSVAGPRFRKVYVVLNPKSGTCDRELARALIEETFGEEGGECRIHEPDDFADLLERVREAVRDECDLIVAAGGDGTVSGVAQGVVGSETALGIIPLGTANVLSKELGIPTDLQGAAKLLSGPSALVKIDAMEVGGKHYFTQVGVGIDAYMIRDTKGEHKRRFGNAAYLWTAVKRLIGFQPRRFTFTVDGKVFKRSASEVVVANCGMLGRPPFRWGRDIDPRDGRLDLCIVRVDSILHYLRLGLTVVFGDHEHNPNVRYDKIEREVTIAARRPVPTQADGEVIGETPITVRLVRGALAVVVPLASDPSAQP